MTGPLEMVGDDAGLCVDGVCALPTPEAADPATADQADASPARGLRR